MGRMEIRLAAGDCRLPHNARTLFADRKHCSLASIPNFRYTLNVGNRVVFLTAVLTLFEFGSVPVSGTL